MRQANRMIIASTAALAAVGATVYGVYRARNSNVFERIRNRWM